MEQDLATGLVSELQNSVDNGLLDIQLVEANLALLSNVRTTEVTAQITSVEDQLQVRWKPFADEVILKTPTSHIELVSHPW